MLNNFIYAITNYVKKNMLFVYGDQIRNVLYYC